MLEPALRAAGTEPDPASLRAAIARSNDTKVLGKIYAYARYAVPDSPEYGPVVDEAWSRITRLA